jgi:hypothetical protein
MTGSFSQLFIILTGAMPILFIGIFFPALYLYVIYRLLQEIDKRDRVAGQSKPI